MSEKRHGPAVLLELSCQGCAFETSEYYCVEDGNDCDSGFNYFCTHPRAPKREEGRMPIGSSTNTPGWCPLLASAVDRVRLEMQQKKIHE